MENRTVKERLELIDHKQAHLSVRRQSKLLKVNKSSLYYKPLGESNENLDLMRFLDEFYLNHPTYGVLRMQDELLEPGYNVNEKRVRRLMRLMGLDAIYPKKNLSRLGKSKYSLPYLLKW